MGNITNSNIEVASWGDGCMGPLNFKKSSEGHGGEDVDLNVPHEFGAFIRHLSPVILRLLFISQLLQHLPEHLGDLAIITSVVLGLVNISIWKMNPCQTCFSSLHLQCNRGMNYCTC
jgi:hypothetical protein